MSQTNNLSTSTDPWPEGAIPQTWVESLFKKMAFTYGTRFADQWRGIDPVGVKRHWAEALGSLTSDELCRGVLGLGTRDWPPTLPEFLKLCRPVVDPVAAYHEALEQGALRLRGEPDAWSKPAIFWAWMKVGRVAFSQVPYPMLKGRWEAALAAELAKETHDPIPLHVEALPAPGRASTSVDRARQLLSGFKIGTRRQTATVQADPLRWARQIMERRDRGEPLEIVQIKDAERALGIR
jgi:hypothetical protein